jgi:hypothetical protein
LVVDNGQHLGTRSGMTLKNENREPVKEKSF